MEVLKILKRFSLISGLNISDSAQWMPLCSESKEQILLHVKSDIDMEKNCNRLCAAAAALTFYKYVLYQASSGGMTSFKAGDVSIKNDKKVNLQIASDIWNDAKNSIVDLIDWEDFVFERIEVK